MFSNAQRLSSYSFIFLPVFPLFSPFSRCRALNSAELPFGETPGSERILRGVIRPICTGCAVSPGCSCVWPIILKWPISPVWPTWSPAHGQLSYVPMVIIRNVRLTCSGRRTVLYIYTYNAAVTTYSRFAFLLM